MNLFDSLLESACNRDCTVKNVCVGLHWTVVESRFTGIVHSHTMANGGEHDLSDDLIGKSAVEIAGQLKSRELSKASLGLAALNSLIEPIGKPGNIFSDIFEEIEGKTVTVVGRFPLNSDIGEAAGRSYFLEMEPEEGELPADACEEVIPQSDIVVISATSIINKTLPRLLELSTEAKAKAFVIGPSTPMSDILISHGVYMLGGIRVTDTDALIDSVKHRVRYSKELAGIEAIVRS